MSRTHLDNMREHPSPDTTRAVSEELAALQQRRDARAAEDQNR